MMKLKDTITMMNSEDYKERFKAEYLQTKIRYEKLHKMCIKYEAGTLNFTPKCSLALLLDQKRHMGMYLHCLEVRAEIEGVSLETAEDALIHKYCCTVKNDAVTRGNNSTSNVEHDYLKCNAITCDNAPEATL